MRARKKRSLAACWNSGIGNTMTVDELIATKHGTKSCPKMIGAVVLSGRSSAFSDGRARQSNAQLLHPKLKC